MFNPVHLRTLIAVVRTGSFADAARRLGYTSSAVSQQIASLERATKVTLFERDARSIHPTAAAELLADRSSTALAHLDELGNDVLQLAQGTLGRVSIGSFPTASQKLLPPALSSFSRELQNVEVRLIEGETDELVGLVQDHELDVGLVYQYDLVPKRWPKDTVRTTILHESLVLLLPEDHALAGEDEVRLDQLSEETWISTRWESSGATFLRRICAQEDFVPHVAFRSNDYEVVRAFVGSGMGIALVPALSHVDSEKVVGRAISGMTAKRHVVCVHRTGMTNRAVTGLLDSLCRSATQIALNHPLLSVTERAT